MTLVLLDSGPLGLLTHPKVTPENLAAFRWLRGLLTAGVPVVLPEIADYEVRRELLRAGKLKGVAKLDQLKKIALYLPLTTAAMLKAADLWAQARQQGQPTASDKALDGDAILAAQALTMDTRGRHPVIATTNVKHLALFADAKLWQDITV